MSSSVTYIFSLLVRNPILSEPVVSTFASECHTKLIASHVSPPTATAQKNMHNTRRAVSVFFPHTNFSSTSLFLLRCKTVIGIIIFRKDIGQRPIWIFQFGNCLELKTRRVTMTLGCIVRVHPRYNVKGLNYFVEDEPTQFDPTPLVKFIIQNPDRPNEAGPEKMTWQGRSWPRRLVELD